MFYFTLFEIIGYKWFKEFYSDPVYNEKYLKAKIKSYNGKTNINFHDNKIPKDGFECI